MPATPGLPTIAHAACGRLGNADQLLHARSRRIGCPADVRPRERVATCVPSARSSSCIYQPQVDLRSGEVIGVEALLRWRCEEFGAVSPAEFVPIAEGNLRPDRAARRMGLSHRLPTKRHLAARAGLPGVRAHRRQS